MKPYMRMYWGDYFANTPHLTTVEHGAYLLLIAAYWEHGCLPQDDRRLARITKLGLRRFKSIKHVLEPLFGPRWTHFRIETELARYKEKSAKTKKAAMQMHANAHARARSRLQSHIKNLPSLEAELSPREAKKAVAEEASAAQPNGPDSPFNVKQALAEIAQLERNELAEAKHLRNLIEKWRAEGAFDEPDNDR